jgi:ABC-2 type transport system ATP-binding protein
MTTAAVEITGVRLRLGQREVIRGLDLRIPEGESVGLIGPNGAGKTTLYRLLLGLGRATSGSIKVLGSAMPDRRVLGRIGYMAQTESLYADLTIEENLLFFGKLYGVNGEAAGRRADEVLQLIDLEPHRNQRVERLSGGMRRRTSLGVSVFHKPELLLLDEPTVGVDPELRIRLWDEFMRLNQSGTTIVVSTHHLDEANRCKKLVLLKEGQVLAQDEPEALKRQTGSRSIEQAFLELARGRDS